MRAKSPPWPIWVTCILMPGFLLAAEACSTQSQLGQSFNYDDSALSPAETKAWMTYAGDAIQHATEGAPLEVDAPRTIFAVPHAYPAVATPTQVPASGPICSNPAPVRDAPSQCQCSEGQIVACSAALAAGASVALSDSGMPDLCNVRVPLPGGLVTLCFRSEVHPLGLSQVCPRWPDPTRPVWHTNVEAHVLGMARAIYNLHSAVWSVGTATCYAIYNSVTDNGPVCLLSDCADPIDPAAVAAIVALQMRAMYDQIKDGFYRANLGLQLDPQTALALARLEAEATVAIIIVILLLIPGPQPI